ncbi:MAG TPA: FUSC family protein, partial [Bradyrhizobium sp.]|nr:FUSC family protein [Bradyrhizobium sp.]
LYRGAQRGVGTAIGAGLGAVAALAHPGLEGQLVAASLCVTAAYALFDVNYLLFSVFLTAFIVVLLNILGMSAVATAEARFFETFIGAAIGLAAYIAWPTWLGVTAQEKFADLLDAHGDYAAGLLQALAHPDSGGASRLRALQAAARRTRSDAEAAMMRLSNEPAHVPLTPAVAQAIIAEVARLTQAELALHALTVAPLRAGEQAGRADAAVMQRIDTLAGALVTAMRRLASALRALVSPEPIPALRPIQAQLRTEPAVTDNTVVGLTDRLVDAVDAIDAILRERFPLASGAHPPSA